MIQDSYDPAREAVLEPSHAAAPLPGFPETAVLTFQPSLAAWAAGQPGAETLCRIPVFFQIPVLRLPWKGRDLALYQTLMGGAVSVAMAEEVIARGARRLVLFGSCGALAGDLPPGGLIVPTQACRDEGTSYHYLPPADYVDLPAAPRVCRVLEDLGLPHRAGRVWTTDALYRETRRNVDRRRGEGCLGVDMECAYLAALCAARGAELLAFLYTEDSLGGESWDPGLLGKLPQDAKEAYLRIALEVALRA